MGAFGFGGDSSSSQQNTEDTFNSTGATSPIIAGGGNKSSVVSTAGAPVFTATGKGTIDYTPTDDGAIDDATQAVLAALQSASSTNGQVIDTTASLLQGQQDANSANTDAQNQLLQQVLNGQSTLAQNVQSGGQSDQNSTILKIVGIAAAVIAAVLILPSFFKK